MQVQKPTIVLVSSFILASVIVFWGIVFNYGTIKVASDTLPFQIEYGNKTQECEFSPCTLKLKPKTYSLIISADNYTLLHKDVKLERSDTELVEYSPLSLPVLTKITEPKEFEKAYFRLENGQSKLYLKTQARGDIVVSTFKTPLQNPEIRVSPLEDYILVWDKEVFPLQVYLIDVPQLSKSSLSIPEAAKIQDLSFLEARKLLVKLEHTVKVYDLDNKTFSFFPLEEIDHYLEVSKDKGLILSRDSLDEFEFDSEPVLSLESLLESSDKNGELTAENNNSYKLYYYLKDQETFIQLLDLGKGFDSPYSLFFSETSTQPEIILQSNDKYYQVQLSL